MTVKTYDYKNLVVQLEDAILTVTFNRANKLNAWDDPTLDELTHLRKEIYGNDAIRVIIFTGSGRAFGVGADLEIFEQYTTPLALRRRGQRLTRFFEDLEALEKPVLAAVNGLCVGGGLEMALACDLRVAADDSRYGFPENKIGITPGIGGCVRLTKLLGTAKAKELILLGEFIDAQEAYRLGLVNWVAPAGLLLEKTREIAEKLSRKAPLALGLAKNIITNCANMDARSGLALEKYAQSILVSTSDHKEGMNAFRGKREPRFMGK